MKQAHDPATQPCGAFPLHNTQPLADFVDSGPALGTPVTPVPAPPPPAGSLRATAILLLGYAILITGNGLLGTLISLRLIQQQAPSIVVGIVQAA